MTICATNFLLEDEGGQSVEFRLNLGLRVVMVVSLLDLSIA